MNAIRRSIPIALVIFVIFPFLGIAQGHVANDSTKSELAKAAQEIMLSAGSCALISIDDEGVPRARTMDPFPPESDFTVWFGTNPKSRKVSQIKNNPNVTLYYLDNDGSGYVTLHGKAEIVNDKAEKEKRWKEEWSAFYENKTDAYTLIKVSPVWLEVISYSRGLVSSSPTWQPPVLYFSSK